MRHQARIAALALSLLAFVGCSVNKRAGETDDGGIILSLTGFGTIPLTMSASGAYPFFQIDSMTVRSILKSPSQPTSDLMIVELQGYEVTYERLDSGGTRVPPRLVSRIVGTIEPGGTFELLNGEIFGFDQFESQPLEDMIEEGYDTETTSTVIRMKVGIRFFGKTIAGDDVETQVAHFTLDILP
jgi:hypothetical protein